jgi:hypothetical protein
MAQTLANDGSSNLNSTGSGIKLRANSSGVPMSHDDVDTNFENLRLKINEVIGEVGTNTTKLSGIASNANNYSLPLATHTVRGGIELFSNTDQSVAANTVTTTAGRTYGIQLNSANQAVVNVPWSNTTYGAATSSVPGLSKLGSNTQQNTAANSVTSTASRTYAVQHNSADQLVVNVPWSNTNTTYSTATSSNAGLVKIGYSENGKKYPVELASGKMFVEVPWVNTDTNTTYSAGTGISISGNVISATATGGGSDFDPPNATLEYSSDTVVVGNGTTSVDFLVRDAAGSDLLFVNADNKDIVAYSNAYLVAGNIPGVQPVKIELSNGSTNTSSYGCQMVMKHDNATTASANSKAFSFDLQAQYNRMSMGWAVSGKTIIYDATDGHFAPSSTDATQDLGLSLWDDNGTAWNGFAWKNVYTVAGALNGSDERIKTQIEDISETEKRVAVKAKGLLKKFKMKSAVKLKGDGARIHFGIIAQELIQAFTDEGLDAFDYSVVGKSEGYILDNPNEGEPPIISRQDNGGRYSYMYVVRYHELLAFIISAL